MKVKKIQYKLFGIFVVLSVLGGITSCGWMNALSKPCTVGQGSEERPCKSFEELTGK